MAQDYRRRFEAMVEGLRVHPAIELREVRFADPIPPTPLARIAEIHGDRAPRGLLDFYGEMDGFSVTWAHTLNPGGPRGDVDTGTINIRPAAEVFGSGPARQFLDDDDRFRPVRPFDIFTSEACAALLQPSEATIPDEVNLHVFGEESLPTGHTTEAYLERLLISRGIWSWVDTLCPELQDLPEVADFRRVAPLLFPDYDDALFQPSYEE